MDLTLAVGSQRLCDEKKTRPRQPRTKENTPAFVLQRVDPEASLDLCNARVGCPRVGLFHQAREHKHLCRLRVQRGPLRKAGVRAALEEAGML